MAVSIVKIPQDVHADYDFVAFSFNNKHSYEDFGIVRVSEGSRYNENLSPTLTDKTAEVPGGDGTYYFNTQHKQKVFNISFAFDGMSEAKLREMKQWLNGKDMADLWFAEAPYKVYTAKVTGTPQMKYVCFDQYNEETGKTERVYKGEGSVTFTAYWPYAHTPDYVENSEEDQAPGTQQASYAEFSNASQWLPASGLPNIINTCVGENPGDIPAPFVLSCEGFISGGTTICIGDAAITIVDDCYDLEWDSRTGLVQARKAPSSGKELIYYIGNSVSSIPVGGLQEEELIVDLSSFYDAKEGDYLYENREGDPKVITYGPTIIEEDVVLESSQEEPYGSLSKQLIEKLPTLDNEGFIHYKDFTLPSFSEIDQYYNTECEFRSNEVTDDKDNKAILYQAEITQKPINRHILFRPSSTGDKCFVELRGAPYNVFYDYKQPDNKVEFSDIQDTVIISVQNYTETREMGTHYIFEPSGLAVVRTRSTASSIEVEELTFKGLYRLTIPHRVEVGNRTQPLEIVVDLPIGSASFNANMPGEWGNIQTISFENGFEIDWKYRLVTNITATGEIRTKADICVYTKLNDEQHKAYPNNSLNKSNLSILPDVCQEEDYQGWEYGMFAISVEELNSNNTVVNLKATGKITKQEVCYETATEKCQYIIKHELQDGDSAVISEEDAKLKFANIKYPITKTINTYVKNLHTGAQSNEPYKQEVGQPCITEPIKLKYNYWYY